MDDNRAAMIRRLLLSMPLLFVAGFLCYPLAAIAHLSLYEGSSLQVLLADDYYPRVLGFSLWQAGVSTILTLVTGLPLAYLLAHYRFRGRGVMYALVTVPFVMPTVVTAAGFAALLGSNGLVSAGLQSLLGDQAPTINVTNTLGIVLLAHVFYNYGVVVRIVGGVWATFDPRLTQAAAILGASPLRTFLHVTLPLLLPAIGAAALLVFIFTFGSFGVMLLLGGPRLATLEVEIYRQTAQLLRLDIAAALAIVQMLVTLLATLVYTRLTARAAVRDLRSADRQRPVRTVCERLVHGAGWLVTILLSAPLAALVVRSLMPLSRGAEGGPTLAYYRMLGENQRGSFFFVSPLTAIGNSLLMALVATLVALVIGIAAAYLLARSADLRYRHGGAFGQLAALADPLFMLPLGASAVTLGLGYVVAFGRLGMLQAIWLIPVAHALLAFPFVVRGILPALRAIDPRLRDAARVLGATPWRIVWWIDLPLLLPALLAAAALAFTVSLGDYGAALLLARPDMPTVPVVIGRLLGQPGAANYGQALALSSILMLVTIAASRMIEGIARIRLR
ncbi:MAG TPA: iron ABC transporter permease [Roseiflexaceae bacterium]|nr:iron ABC transporter permease [Roseiflexaceae bacterium]HMP42897.1 iron ABC transporter permease [Roseiflexaceae bacterium]